MLAQTPCRERANRWEPKDYFIISAIGLEAAASVLKSIRIDLIVPRTGYSASRICQCRLR